MQFIKNGPAIPETLLQAHEEGRVVLFCGAGISFPAGLPGFQKLVEQLYESFSPKPSDVQAAALKAKQYDIAVSLLEEEIADRALVRREMANLLSPDLSGKDALTTHRALLSLSKTRKGHTRLITTNFDRLFQEVATQDKLQLEQYCAPLLPIPKNRWNGLVYLHGLLHEAVTDDALDRLVISSGDFGLAYLTERWAARFVSELFRNYVVCFVGYSLADPVLRYMTDALAADRLRGEASPEMYAFGSYTGMKSSYDQMSREWRAKNVVPILYKETKGHMNLHHTIRAWATTYETGARGKGKIVQDSILAGPLASTAEDDHVGRMLWAISEPEGTPARLFSEYSPAPPLEWLSHFCDDRFEHRDLPRFGVTPHRDVNAKLRFSLAKRPMPYGLAPWMCIVSNGRNAGPRDFVMLYLCQWLLRHLDDPKLLLWFVEQGGHLTEDFGREVRRRLEETVVMEEQGIEEEIVRFKSDAPNGIPRPAMRKLWNLVLLGRAGPVYSSVDVYDWIRRLKRDGMTTALRLQLKDYLVARVDLREPVRFEMEDSSSPNQEEPVRYLVSADVVLAENHLRSTLESVRDSQQWRNGLPQLFAMACEALHDALDLMRELGRASEHHDLGMWHLPSILEHWQNKHYHDWTFLVELVRDSWTVIHDENPARARDLMLTLRSVPYPSFMRLGLYAAHHDGALSGDRWVEWLLEDDAWWLWSTETQREVMRLLQTNAGQLNDDANKRLQDAILAGPPRRMFKGELDDARWTEIVERTQRLRLAKVRASGASLLPASQDKLVNLEAKYSRLQFEEFEREEFPYWTSGTGAPDFKFEHHVDLAPRRRGELTTWLQKPPERGMFNDDDWRELCQTQSPVAVAALLELAEHDIWPVTRWDEALSVWSSGGLSRRSWRYLAKCVEKMPDEIFSGIVSTIGWWLKSVAKRLDRHERTFFNICQTVLGLPHDGSPEIDGTMLLAMSHPAGLVVQALVNKWFSERPKDNQGIPATTGAIFTQVCDASVERFRHGRIVLASNVVTLYRIDPAWTKLHLLPLFDWETSRHEAQAAWMGYLSAPRLYKPLLLDLKKSFLEAARWYDQFADVSTNYASMLTLAALDAFELFSRAELQSAVRTLPIEGLVASAQEVHRALEGADEHRTEYWSQRVRPYFATYWPKALSLSDERLSETLARIAVAADTGFPDALDTVKSWLQPLQFPYQVLTEMNEQLVGEKHPKEALKLLLAVIDMTRYPPAELHESLQQIAAAAPELSKTRDFQSLEDFSNRR